MFELPESKRVRREDLYGSSSEDDAAGLDRDTVSAAQAKLKAQLSRLYSFDLPDQEKAGSRDAAPSLSRPSGAGAGDEPPPAADELLGAREEQEQVFEFRLFSTSGGTSAAPPKVVLTAGRDDETGAGDDNGALACGRPPAYYLAAEPTPEQKEAMRLSAVTGDQVLRGAKQQSWGLEVPWRVTKITISTGKIRRASAATTVTQPVLGEAEDLSREKGKRRPGKKRRIALRVKEKAKKERQAKAEHKKLTKEEQLREKKTRLNRERKLKRRQKGREQKAAAKSGEVGEEDGVESGTDGGTAQERRIGECIGTIRSISYYEG